MTGRMTIMTGSISRRPLHAAADDRLARGVSRPAQMGGDRSTIASQLIIQPSAVGPAAPDEDTIV
jgi:hypothetical protein